MNKNTTARNSRSVFAAIAGAVIISGLTIADSSFSQGSTSSSSVVHLGAFSVENPNKSSRHYHNKNYHEGAELVVFRSAFYPKERYGLLFLQKKPSSRQSKSHGAFVCDDAIQLGNDKALRCMRAYEDRGGSLIAERLTVGMLDSKFCKDLRTKLPNSEREVIIKPNECRNEGLSECICWELERHPPVSSLIYAPPGNGAGSGGSH